MIYRFSVTTAINTFSAVTKALTAPLVIHPCDISLFFLFFCPGFVLASGLQAVLPDYLRARFVQAALSYIGCNEEGQFVCRDNDCWCHCAVDYPQCNCPEVDLKAMEASLLKIRDSWNMANQDFEESGLLCFLFLLFFNCCDPPTDSKLDLYC